MPRPTPVDTPFATRVGEPVGTPVGEPVGTPVGEPASGALAWRIFACFAAGYFMSYGLRSVNAVLAPDLVGELSLTNAQLGALTSAYFFAFAGMQLPLGVWLDRFGPRRVDAVLMAVAGLGCVVFAVSTSFGALWFGRALVGVGVSAGLMASLTAFRQWFAPQRQTQLAAWMLMVGTMGVLTTTVPVHWVLPVLGWRGVFWVAAAMLVAVAVLMWTVLPRDRERKSAVPTPSFLASMAGYREVFRHGYFWRMAATGAVVQGGFIAMQSLWVGPWFNKVLGMSADQGADRLFVFNLVLLASFLALGWVAPRVDAGRQALVRIVAIGTAALIALEIAIALAEGTGAWRLWLLYAAVATHYTLVQPRVGMVFPSHLAGRALTAFNLVIFVGVFLSQWGFGVVIDAFRTHGQSETAAFRSAMLVLAGMHAASLALFVLWPRRWASPGAAPRP